MHNLFRPVQARTGTCPYGYGYFSRENLMLGSINMIFHREPLNGHKAKPGGSWNKSDFQFINSGIQSLY